MEVVGERMVEEEEEEEEEGGGCSNEESEAERGRSVRTYVGAGCS